MTYRTFRNGKEVKVTEELRQELTKRFVESFGYKYEGRNENVKSRSS